MTSERPKCFARRVVAATLRSIAVTDPASGGVAGVQLPGEIQNTTLMAAGIVATSQAPDAARAFIGFISSPIAAAVFRAGGFQPVDNK
jgi:ABC-type molybdate transport system substrate-binding protein